MKIQSLIEVLCAAHWTSHVESPYRTRGGIMLIAPPGALKTSVISILEEYPDALVLSDLTTQGLVRIRDEIAAGRVRTLAIQDVQKIYERHPSTSSNIEGNLRALVEEGFTRAAFEDSQMMRMRALALVIGAMTPDFYAQRYTHWQASGFVRRFLWCQYRLKNPVALMEAIHEWRRLEYDQGSLWMVPLSRVIKYDLSREESKEVAGTLRYQNREAPFMLAKRLLVSLKYRYAQVEKKPLRASERAMAVYKDFAECLSRDGAEMEI